MLGLKQIKLIFEPVGVSSEEKQTLIDKVNTLLGEKHTSIQTHVTDSDHVITLGYDPGVLATCLEDGTQFWVKDFSGDIVCPHCGTAKPAYEFDPNFFNTRV